jgi:hypothetical protein
MGSNACPNCGQPIATDDINVGEGVALCRGCGKLSRLSEVLEQPTTDPTAITRPPAGCSYDGSYAGATVIRASLRSIGSAAGMLAICLFWNGIVSVFLVQAIGGLYFHFVGDLPEWFPMASAGEGSRGHPIPLGMTLFLCLFLTPFVVIGVCMIGAFFCFLFGAVEVDVSGSDGRVRTSIGVLRWTRRFDASQVTRVSLGQTKWQENGRSKELIEIEAADRTVRFGTMLSPERRQWLMTVLHMLLVRRAGIGARMAGSTIIRR